MTTLMNDVDWETLYTRYAQARGFDDAAAIYEILEHAHTTLSDSSLQELGWFKAALQDQERQWFVALALRKNSTMPELLFTPMIETGVAQTNPHDHIYFIEPVMRCFGPRRVNLTLLYILEDGSDAQKAGAAQCLYCSLRLVGHRGIANDAIYDIQEQCRRVMLRTFVSNENVHLRRCILTQLNFDEERYPEELRPLLPEAIRIARTHPDAYIRHQIRVQLGETTAYVPLPNRE